MYTMYPSTGQRSRFLVFQIPRVFIHVFVELIFQKVKMVIVRHLLVGMRLRSPGSSGW